MRPCRDCGRDVHDPDEHEGRPRVCKNLVLIADRTAVDLATGERVVREHYIPETPQRTRQNNARFVHRATLAAQS